MVLAAIIASNSQTQVATTGPTGVVGLTYSHIAQDIVDWIAWAQNSKPGCCGDQEGGWRYYSQYGESDNSVSQWPVMGLLAAELWGLNAPSWVGTELLKWTASDQELTGTPSTNPLYGAFDYQPGRQLSPAETAAGILELTYAGVPDTDSRILAAEGYLYADWGEPLTFLGYTGCVGPTLTCAAGYSYDGEYGWNWNIGALYDMYAIMKAMTTTSPTPTTYIPNYANTASVEWYNGAGEYADSLITNQNPDGSWLNWVSWAENGEVSYNLMTAFAILILEYVPVKVTYTLEVDVVNNVGNPISGASVSAVGPTTLGPTTTDASGKVVFKDTQAGTYDVSASLACYSTASNPAVNLDVNTVVKLTLTPTSCKPVVGVPEFGASSVMMVAALCAALLILMGSIKPMRSKKLQSNTR
jgi:hypothetical protein